MFDISKLVESGAISEEVQANIQTAWDSKVKENQINSISKIKSERNQEKVNRILEELTLAAKNNTGNLLEITIRAAKERATLGEISSALEKEFGRYKATIRTISGVYSSESMKDKEF